MKIKTNKILFFGLYYFGFIIFTSPAWGRQNEEAFHGRDHQQQQQAYPVQASYRDHPLPWSTHFPREDPTHEREVLPLREEV
jgi:hypothetical protein